MSDKVNKLNRKLKRLTIRDFPEDLHLFLKVEAAKRGVTIGEFLTQVCEQWQKNPSVNEER